MTAAHSLTTFSQTPAGQPFEFDGTVYRIRMACGLWFSISPEDFKRVGQFKWHAKRFKSSPSKVYVQRSVNLGGGKKTAVALHRFLLGETDPKVLIDHRHGDPLVNTRDELRRTDARGNATNVTKSKRQKAGGWKGVSWHPGAGKWQASICAGEIKPNGKRRQIYLGLFDDPKEAARAYDREARKHFGTFANCNFDEEQEFLDALAEHSERGAVAELLADDGGEGSKP